MFPLVAVVVAQLCAVDPGPPSRRSVNSPLDLRAPKGETKAHMHRAEAVLCSRLAPTRPMFASATHEDTRAALLIGEACALVWRWT